MARITPEIKARYEGLEVNVYDVFRAEEERKVCEQCEGLPCRKMSNRESIPVIVQVNGAVSVSCGICKYKRASLRQSRIGRMFKQSQIPAQYIGKGFDDYEIDANNKDAVKAAKYLIDHADIGAYFFGSFGVGKTYLAAIIAQEIIRKGRAVLFASVPEITSAIRATYRGNSEVNETQILTALYEIPSLILDDIGTDKPTKFVSETLGKIINNRYNAGKQTILTSNYTLEELEEFYNNPTDGGKTMDGSRIYDRCKEFCLPVRLKGKSRRGLKCG